jgi:hypothetical protein
MTEVNNVEFTVANVNTGANTFELSGIDSTGYTAYDSGGNIEEIYEIATPWLDEEIFDVRKAQSSDVMYMTHPDHQVQQLSRMGDTNWTMADAAIEDGPYAPIDTNDVTLSLSATSGTVTVTASSAIFASTDTSGTGGTGTYDRHLRIQDKDTARGITNIAQSSPAVVTYAGPDVLANGDTVYISGVVGMTEVNGNSYKVDNVNTSAKTFELENINSTGFTAYVSGGTAQRKYTTISGLEHLEAETVIALADGNLTENLTVTNGSITIPDSFVKAQVGLSYQPLIESMPINSAAQTISKYKNVKYVVMRVLDTRGIFAGTQEDNLEEYPTRSTELWGDPAKAISTIVRIPISDDWRRDSSVIARATPGLPQTILSMVPDTNVGGG